MAAGVPGGPGVTNEQFEADRQRQLAEAEAKRAEAEARRVAALREQGLDARGLPLRPEFADIFEEGGDRLREGFRIGEFDDIALDTRALDRITEEGLSEGPTRGAQRQLDLQKLQQAQAFDDLRRGEAGAQQQAFDALARQGGLSGGARERLARAGQRNVLLGRQGVRGQGAQQRLGILAADEQAKRQLLGQAQAGAFQRGQFDQTNRQFEAQRRQFDIQNALSELQSKRDAELRAFEADRQAAAATKQAEAQARASCFAEGTLLPMADGTYKKIEDIELDDSLKVGGIIFTIVKTRCNEATDVYNYQGVLVTGGHAVLEHGKWVRVKDSEKAMLYTGRVEYLYNLANELHLIEIAGVLFADYEETDSFHELTDEESLEVLNRQLHERIKSSEKRLPLC